MSSEDNSHPGTADRDFDIRNIPGCTRVSEGLTHLNVDVIHDYVLETKGEAWLDRAWRQIIPQWLAMLAGELNGDYEIEESEEFTILRPSSMQNPQELLDHAERSRVLFTEFWPGLNIERDVVGKHVVIITESHDDFYDYVCEFYPDGNFGGSTGICIRSSGYTHIAINQTDAWNQRATLTHEIGHALLAQLPLPPWVEEGMVQLVEEHLNGYNRGISDIALHREFWSEHTLAGFWLGSAFIEAGDGQQLSYELARQIVFDLAVKDRKRFIAFANQANGFDAGQAAAIKQFGHGLARCLPHNLQMYFEDSR